MRIVPTVCAFAILGLVAACSGNTFQAGGSSSGSGGVGGGAGKGVGGGAGKGAGGSSAGKGGAASGGSASGSGGASGAAGSGACVSGNACGPEGSTCSEDSCCPCLYTCRGGAWEISACPSCPAPSCPPEPPADGQPCGGDCFDPVGLDCSWDECAASGVRYSGICNGSSWSVVAEPCSGVACCENDTECAPLICVNTICKEPMGDGCWRDEDCGPDSLCSGVAVCPCNADCGNHDSLGTCVPANSGCCKDDTDCVGGRCAAGVCRALADPNQCWSNRDCLGTVCMGAELCVCGETCTGIETPGTCG